MANEVNTMPYNRDAEMALLGCMIIDNEIVSELVEKLTEDDFYIEAHKLIIRAMRAVFDGRKPVDLVTLSDELDAEGTLEKAGGIAYLAELAEITPSAANYKSYHEIVERDGTNRRLIRASRKIIENCMKSADTEGSVSFAEKAVYDISQSTENSALVQMNEGGMVDTVLERFEKLQVDPNSYKGLPTGYKHLDRITHGLQPGTLIVLAARPGMGKTSLAMNLVENISLRAGKTSAVFSLEMPRQEIVQRLVCAYSKVSMKKALDGQLVAEEWKKLMPASDQLKRSKIYIDDSSRVTPQQILSKCRRLKSQTGSLDFIMIDYIQLMSGGGDKKSASAENRQQEIASITRDLKIMAKELGVPVLALSQLRRMQTKEPQLSDLRESGAIEQDADIVMFINRPDQTATLEDLQSGKIVQGAAELHLAKHRGGEQGRIAMRFIGEWTKFIDVDEQNRNEEPPEYSSHAQEYEEEDEEYEYEDDGYIPPEPVQRKSDLKATDEDIPFEYDADDDKDDNP